jgi:hypothetical protein
VSLLLRISLTIRRKSVKGLSDRPSSCYHCPKALLTLALIIQTELITL